MLLSKSSGTADLDLDINERVTWGVTVSFARRKVFREWDCEAPRTRRCT